MFAEQEQGEDRRELNLCLGGGEANWEGSSMPAGGADWETRVGSDGMFGSKVEVKWGIKQQHGCGQVKAWRGRG